LSCIAGAARFIIEKTKSKKKNRINFDLVVIINLRSLIFYKSQRLLLDRQYPNLALLTFFKISTITLSGERWLLQRFIANN
jgi:hypothetical protein